MVSSPPPTLERERDLWARGLTRVVGVDEVGVGPISGALVAAAVLLPPDCRPIEGVRDSKLLTAAMRAVLADEIRAQAIAIGLGAASVAEIDTANVLNAAHLAMRRALLRIGSHDHVLVDGRPIRGGAIGEHTAIVDGDSLSYAIACASIVAKVTRDRMMDRLARRHPEYGWEHNRGYGSRDHLAALERFGATPYHRRSFEPVRRALGLPPLPRNRVAPDASTPRRRRRAVPPGQPPLALEIGP